MIWAQTDRLILREWEDRDIAPFAALNADPVVMEHFPAPMSFEQTEAMVARLREAWAANGFSFAAVERSSDRAFIGMVGLHRPGYDVPGAPVVEIGWRIARAYWRQGYAVEAARAALAKGFGALGLAEIVSFTSQGNLPSQAVMRALGMRHDPTRDFAHPMLPDGHRLSAHVLYVFTAEEFTA